MKDKIGFICIGQAGGNVGAILEKHRYPCIFINTSKEDLETLDTRYRYHIKDGEGCNHNREKAISLIKDDYKHILEEVEDKLHHQLLIFLVFSAGGGTGSGCAPILLEMLNSQNNKHYGCVTILPSEKETTKAHVNSYKCYQELSNIDKLASVFTLDNNKLDRFKLNNMFVKLFNDMIDIPNHINTKGNVDKAELWEILNTRGNSIITTCSRTSSSHIIKSWENNVFADIEKDKNIVYMGLSLTEDVNVDDLEKFIGKPYDVFQNYNRDQTVTILSGLSFPHARINSIINTIEGSKDTIKSNLINSKTNKITETIEWLDEYENENVGLEKLDDILLKY